MPKFRIEVTQTMTDVYEVEAYDMDEALDTYAFGKLIEVRDEGGYLIEVYEITNTGEKSCKQ